MHSDCKPRLNPFLDVIKSNFHTAKSGCGINILLWAKQALLRSRCSIIILPFNVPAWKVGMWLSSQRRSVSEKLSLRFFWMECFMDLCHESTIIAVSFYLFHIERARGGCTARWHWDESCCPSRFIIAKLVGVFIMWPRKTAEKWLFVASINSWAFKTFLQKI